jgi:hypothetical protein
MAPMQKTISAEKAFPSLSLSLKPLRRSRAKERLSDQQDDKHKGEDES